MRCGKPNLAKVQVNFIYNGRIIAEELLRYTDKSSSDPIW